MQDFLSYESRKHHPMEDSTIHKLMFIGLIPISHFSRCCMISLMNMSNRCFHGCLRQRRSSTTSCNGSAKYISKLQTNATTLLLLQLPRRLFALSHTLHSRFPLSRASVESGQVCGFGNCLRRAVHDLCRSKKITTRHILYCSSCIAQLF